MQKHLKIDLAIVTSIVILAIPLSLFTHANFLTSTILFFVLPSLYLLLRQKRQLRKIFVASGIFGIVFGFAVDFLAEINNAWSWASTNQLVFPYKILGVVNVDVMIWFFFWVFFTIIFYEHFFERDRIERISSHFKYALFPMSLIIILFIFAYYLRQNLLLIPYAYLVLGIFALLPLVFLIIKRPHILPKLLKASIFFVFVYFAYELTALSLDQWRFPGQYIGIVKIKGIVFPLEELFFWILSSSTILLSYYELGIDDMK